MDSPNGVDTIMVVDDRPGNLNLLQELLTSRGYRVLTFPDGRLALQAARRTPPDLILLDIDMPGMNGFEVCRHLRGDEALHEVPVLFISAITATRDKVKAFDVGGMDYVTKPFHFEEVCARIGTHLRLRKLQAQLQHHNDHLEELVQQKVREITEAQLATIHALSKVSESRDEDTGHHIERTQTFCQFLARRLAQNPAYASHVDDAFLENIYHASPLHDIGKVGIPDHILLKPGKLTPIEFEVMKNHAAIGARTLENVHSRYPQNRLIEMGIEIARYHHERWDGSGYPDGLAGSAIPLAARIMALADVYDALRAKRPYKPPYAHDKSLRIIVESSGTHFDPAIVEAFASAHEQFAALHDGMSNGD